MEALTALHLEATPALYSDAVATHGQAASWVGLALHFLASRSAVGCCATAFTLRTAAIKPRPFTSSCTGCGQIRCTRRRCSSSRAATVAPARVMLCAGSSVDSMPVTVPPS
ncbi:hypothetical protein TRVL_02006 [Trypanosoma vivax]|nr:hypothetical protein TRVL_02006 [Trypanosoma vivax]